jgi:hypothetical protein
MRAHYTCMLLGWSVTVRADIHPLSGLHSCSTSFIAAQRRVILPIS